MGGRAGAGWRRYVIADVFTAVPLEGNQLAVFPDGRDLGTDVMQRTARELNLSETVFFLPAEDAADVRLRIFTPPANCPSPAIRCSARRSCSARSWARRR